MASSASDHLKHVKEVDCGVGGSILIDKESETEIIAAHKWRTSSANSMERLKVSDSKVEADVKNANVVVDSDPKDSGEVHNGKELRIPVPWGHIAAKAWGSSNGHPVLGVHGWMDNAGTFDGIAPLLSKSLYLVAVDLPGHGFSSHLPPGTPYHYTDFIIQLRRVVNHFKWSRFSWIGHSMGAGLGALYASVFPSQVKPNTNYNARVAAVTDGIPKKSDTPLSSECGNFPIERQVDKLIMLDLVKPITGDSNNYANKISMAIDSYLSIEEKIQPEPPTYSYESAVDRLIGATDNTLTVEAARTLLIRGSRQVSEDQWCYTRDLRLRGPSINRFSHDQCFTILNEIRCPTLIVKAKDAPWFEKQEICKRALEIYEEKCAEFKYLEVEGNHFVHLNEPELLSDAVNQFLTREHKAGL